MVERPDLWGSYSCGEKFTFKKLKVKVGLDEMIFDFRKTSNFPAPTGFTTKQFNAWKNTCESLNIPLPSMELIRRKVQDFREAQEYFEANLTPCKQVKRSKRLKKKQEQLNRSQEVITEKAKAKLDRLSESKNTPKTGKRGRKVKAKAQCTMPVPEPNPYREYRLGGMRPILIHGTSLAYSYVSCSKLMILYPIMMRLLIFNMP